MSVKFLLHVVLAAIASRGVFAPTAAASSSAAEPPQGGGVLVQLNPNQLLEGWLWSKLPCFYPG